MLRWLLVRVIISCKKRCRLVTLLYSLRHTSETGTWVSYTISRSYSCGVIRPILSASCGILELANHVFTCCWWSHFLTILCFIFLYSILDLFEAFRRNLKGKFSDKTKFAILARILDFLSTSSQLNWKSLFFLVSGYHSIRYLCFK